MWNKWLFSLFWSHYRFVSLQFLLSFLWNNFQSFPNLISKFSKYIQFVNVFFILMQFFYLTMWNMAQNIEEKYNVETLWTHYFLNYIVLSDFLVFTMQRNSVTTIITIIIFIFHLFISLVASTSMCANIIEKIFFLKCCATYHKNNSKLILE